MTQVLKLLVALIKPGEKVSAKVLSVANNMYLYVCVYIYTYIYIQ
jgi:hypothetical protein